MRRKNEVLQALTALEKYAANEKILQEETVEKKLTAINLLQENKNAFACYAIKAIENGLFE